MAEINPLAKRLIVLVKQHKKPSSPKSTAVLVKVLESQLLNPGDHSVAEFKTALESALNSDIVLSEVVRQQHSEDELRGCFANLLEALKQD
ncbi:hypothetical protein [Bdellovibrio sp. HCB209]|uniref:hypothetical protein n=1 Tax=Bdellovibrio sp. HCB209 TaxID=3394354 RepID=UPI0039B54F01